MATNGSIISLTDAIQITAEQAINDKKPEDLHRAAHTLKSTSLVSEF
jgi:hypothetical protein